MGSPKAGWRVELSDTARRQVQALDETIRRRILKFLQARLYRLEDPRLLGEALKGERFGELWRYRVGDYRIIAQIEDRSVRIVIVTIGHRREIYR